MIRSNDIVLSFWVGSPLLLGVLFGAACDSVIAADPFLAAIRPTDPLDAEDEQKSFHLPPGFEIELFAAEPDLQKPMNLAFDTKGRLWVSGSSEYPFPAAMDKPGRDTIKILEDTNGDGQADKVTTFADGLNIPIGLYPYRNGVIAFSIPNIYFLEDTDGDDHVDQRHVLFGPLDYTHDTHGLNNAFRRGLDGWIYACHGWDNRDKITGRDGSAISINGGATYRFRPDGARVELFTRGQVNPFGMTVDARGDMFSADCHTKPIMLLLRGGCYENFGKPHDGLGFVPHVMEHDHGATAIAGTTVYEPDDCPPEYRGNMFAGNVMTSRVNRYSMSFNGSTVIALKEPDFVTSDDPWFRPVDLQVGPDGALYIADFYNRIIGHYEVPLDHPGRDRYRGRIWRVTYVGQDKDMKQNVRSPDLSKATVEKLMSALESSNITLRLCATDELSDHRGESAVKLLRRTAHQSQSATARVHSLWALFRQKCLNSIELLEAAKDSNALVRIHANRIIAETTTLSPEIEKAMLSALSDPDGFVRRAAADALGQHPDFDATNQLLDLLSNTPKDDVHLRHMARIALRQQLRPEGRLAKLKVADSTHLALIADVALGIDSAAAGDFLADYLARLPIDDSNVTAYAKQAARYIPAEQVESLIGLARIQSPANLESQVEMYSAVDQGLQQRGLAMPTAFSLWGVDLIHRLLAPVEPEKVAWTADPVGSKEQKLWPLEQRNIAGEISTGKFLSSLPLGEQYTGVLRSKSFVIPSRLDFFICGHLGPTDSPPIAKNLVRLKLVATNQVISQSLAPRNDIAQKVSWDLQSYRGQEGYLEIVDGVKTPLYAWIGVGRFSPPVIRVPRVTADIVDEHYRLAIKLIARLRLVDMSDKLTELICDESLGLETRAAALQSFVALHPQSEGAALAEHVTDASISETTRERILHAVASQSDERVKDALTEVMRTAPERLQKDLALKLAERKSGGETLLAMLEKGIGTARLLQNETLVQKLQLATPERISQRIEALTANLPAQNEETRQLITRRRQEFLSADVSVGRGEKVFAQNCMPCHQIRGRGALIGPQLDGIGNRGEERVIEDILDPNRNVDLAFRSSTYLLEDGRVLSGLYRRLEGKLTVIADASGKETSFPSKDIEVENKSKSSLMPSNFGTLLSKQDFLDLVAMLVADRQSKPVPINGTIQ